MSLIEIRWHPPPRELRAFGLIAAVFCLAGVVWTVTTSSLLGFTLDPATARGTAMGLGAGVFLCVALALWAPARLRPVYLALILVTLPIGFAVSHIILAVLFFGLITPIGLLFRLAGRDALTRSFDRRAPTYWVRRPVASRDRYFRQF